MRLSCRIVLLLSVLLLTSGCWGYRDLENLALVTVLGIDIADDEERITLTAQMQRPTSQGEGGGGGSGQPAFWTTGTTGYTISEALRNLRRETGRRLLLTQLEAIVFGEDLAKDGIRPYVDYFIREPDIRLRTLLVVAKGKAEKILQAEHPLEEVPGTVIRHEGEALSSIIVARDIRQAAIDIYNETTELTLGHIAVIDDGKQLFLSAGAIFKENKLVQFLTQKEARGWNWVMDPQAAGIVVIVESPTSPGTRISIEVDKVKSQMSVKKSEEGAFTGLIRLKVEGSILENYSPGLDLAKPDNIETLARRFAQVAANEIINATKVAKQNKADVFGFGDSIRRNFPNDYGSVRHNWADYFATMEINVEVEATVTQTNLLL